MRFEKIQERVSNYGTGTIISDKYVLTSADNLRLYNYYYINYNSEIDSSLLCIISGYIINKKQIGSLLINNLIKLNSNFEFFINKNLTS